jgi:putative ABC transport system ATP-binding protein
MNDEQARTAPTVALLQATCRYEQGERRVEALRGVDLRVDAGEMVAVIGPSASGKSTLVQAICGIVPLRSGDIRFEGTSVRLQTPAWWATARRRVMGVVLQRLNLIDSLDVLGNISLPLVLDGAHQRDADRGAREALEQVGLDPSITGALPGEISGGEQQRVAIARAIVGKRRLILADEPTAAVDTVTAESIVELLGSLASAGRAVLMTTHDTRLAGWADRVVTLRDGTVAGGASESDRDDAGYVMSPVDNPELAW